MQSKETPIRVYRYRREPWRQFMADAAAAVTASVAVAMATHSNGLLVSLVPAMLVAAVGCSFYSFALWLRRRSAIAVYPDRVAWTDGWGHWRAASLNDIGTPTGAQKVGVDGPGTEVETPVGPFGFSYSLQGYADLNRRLTWAKQGLAALELPIAPAVWDGPLIFRYGGGLRDRALAKYLVAAVLAFPLFMAGLAWTALSALLFVWGTFDALTALNARIEVDGEHLVWFDHWGRKRSQVRIGALQGAIAQGFSHRLRGRLETDDGDIPFGPNLDGAEDLMRGAFEVIAKRHAQAIGTP